MVSGHNSLCVRMGPMPKQPMSSDNGPTPSLHGAPGCRGLVFMHPAAAPSFVPFPAGRMILGRDPGAGLPLDGQAVSWQHAELITTGDDVFIRDLDSTNGVMVRGQLVKEERLSPGALVRIGDFLGLVASDPFPSPPAFKEAEGLGFIVGPILGAALAPIGGLRAGRPVRFAIEGETGTGKSMVARLIHTRVRSRGPFVALDGASLDDGEPLDRALEEATRGSVYVANVTALPPPTQTRLADLLRAPKASGLCLIVGSQEPLAKAVRQGNLLPALHAALEQLGLVTVVVPPLRERVVEVPALFRQLLAAQATQGERGRSRARKVPSLSTELVERLCLYDWPCNVREMTVLVQQLVTFHGDEPRLRAAHLPVRFMPPGREGTTLPVVTPVTGVDLGALLDAVRDAGGNIGGAALRLGITRERAYRLIDRLGVVRGSA